MLPKHPAALLRNAASDGQTGSYRFVRRISTVQTPLCSLTPDSRIVGHSNAIAVAVVPLHPVTRIVGANPCLDQLTNAVPRESARFR